jgi:hypothetical protein
LEQRFPIRFGPKQLFFATTGTGAITAVQVNGQPWTHHDATQVFLPFETVPDGARIEIALGAALPTPPRVKVAAGAPEKSSAVAALASLPAELRPVAPRIARLERFCARLNAAGLGESYEAAHARLAVDFFATTRTRLAKGAAASIAPLPPATQKAADESYRQTVERLCEGLEAKLGASAQSADPAKQQLARWWAESAVP